MKPINRVELVSSRRSTGGRRYDIYLDGALAEGGFFTFHAAKSALTEWQAYVRNGGK